MGQTTEIAIARKSPLDEIHRAFGASMQECNGWSLPASYGDRLFEYAAVRERGAGLIDLSSYGRFHVSGTEAVQFLNGLITNDMKTLEENSWMFAAFPNVQGRLLASVRVIRCGDGFLIDTEAATHDQVFKLIERFTLAGDFHVSDLTGNTALLSVQGKRAVEIIQSTLGAEAAEIPRHGAAQTHWQESTLTVLRATHTGEDGFDIVIEANQAQKLWDALVNAGARPVGYDALNMLRIEAGQPRYGIDMDESNVVTETNLDDAVSYTKGCYIGQEIIARIKYRGHVAKKLMGVIFAGAGKLYKDAKIKALDDKEIGRLTSMTFSPYLGRTIALAYVKYDYLAPGTKVKVTSAAEEIDAQIIELPFVRGSWYDSGQAGELMRE
jgi:glycine cleavage system T protein